jgi:transposase-like protein
MDYYDEFNYKNTFAHMQQNEEDSDIEMKDLNSLDEESVKIMEKNWNDDIKERMYQEEMDKETAPNKTWNTGFNRRMLISTKLEAIKYVKENNNIKAAQKFNVTEGTIRYWRKNESLYIEAELPTKKITIHDGRKADYIDIESTLLKFIETNRKFGNPITVFS